MIKLSSMIQLRLALTAGFFLAVGHAGAAVPPERLAILARGANITTLFEMSIPDLEPDLRMIAASGLKHVRLQVIVDLLTDPAYLHRLDRLVQEARHDHLGLILCMHSKTHPWNGTVAVSDLWTTGWTKLARRYQTTSPDWVFFELANEPQVEADQWLVAQEHLRQLIRASVPHHTLLLTGSPYSTVWALPNSVTTADDDIAYVFHLYQPMVVTHQGADWAPEYRPFYGLAYPPNAANIDHLSNPMIAARLDAYRHDGQYMMQREIDQAQAWSARMHVSVVCTEFGIYSKADQASRVAWLSEARKHLAAAGIGWTVWEYKGGFGVAPLTPQAPFSDALGLDH